jgi:apolipoprotein N-acyltransferase
VAYGLVRELREFLSEQPVPFVVGNDDGQLAKDEQGRNIRVDYNAAILFEKGEIVETYRKLHLVPFTENFPYKERLPRIYQWLKDADTHFWEEGDEYTVFDAAGVRFSTPICFEDTFPYLNRGFVRHGAEVLVNLTNDSWSKAVACEMQHMSIALFRALENKRTLVRSTNGGITCVIDPNGRITAMLPPFTEDYLIAEAPVYTAEQTLYTRWGDWFAFLVSILAVLGLAAGLARHLRRP